MSHDNSIRGALLHVLAGLEHILADDDCEQCKANKEQAKFLADFLADYIRRVLDDQ